MDPVYKTGRQSADDPFEFVMSDESVDRAGDIIVQTGWKLAEFRSNPVALYGHNNREPPIGLWSKVRVEGKRLIGRLQLAEPGTSPFIDTLRSLLEQRILRAVSVGFQPIEHEPIDEKEPWGPRRFLKQRLLECSLVAVPANPNAVQLAKSLSAADRSRLFVESDALNGGQRFIAESGKAHAQTKGRAMPTIAERILKLNEEIAALRDQQTPIAVKVKNGEDVTEEETATLDRLDKEIEDLLKARKPLETAERALGLKAAIQAPTPPAPAIIGRAKPGKEPGDRPFDLLVKLAVCSFQSHATRAPMIEVRNQRYGTDEELDAVLKAVTNPAMTTVAGWAAELVTTAIDDYIAALTPLSVYGPLSALGTRVNFGRAGSITLPARNKVKKAPGDLRGAFVGEGAPIPVRRGSFGSLLMRPYKMGVISTYTREIAMHSTPAIEALIREGILEDNAVAIDEALLDNRAGTAVRPAGLLNGVVALPASTAGGYDAMEEDIDTVMGPFIANSMASGIAFILNPANAFKMSRVRNPLGVRVFEADVRSGQIAGQALITSETVPDDQLIAVRASDFATATGDTPTFDVSDQATLHEDDGTYADDNTVTQPAATVKPIVSGPGPGTPAFPVRSLWQTASIGIRMLLDMSWGLRRTATVQYIDGINWGPAAP